MPCSLAENCISGTVGERQREAIWAEIETGWSMSFVQPVYVDMAVSTVSASAPPASGAAAPALPSTVAVPAVPLDPGLPPVPPAARPPEPPALIRSVDPLPHPARVATNVIPMTKIRATIGDGTFRQYRPTAHMAVCACPR